MALQIKMRKTEERWAYSQMFKKNQDSVCGNYGDKLHRTQTIKLFFSLHSNHLTEERTQWQTQ